jgi:Glutathione S-transferase N-terminal domain
MRKFIYFVLCRYEVVGSTTNFSKKHKVPFIELNGEQYDDSDFIIEMLTERYHLEHLEVGLTDKEKGNSRAIQKLAENSLVE